MGALDGIRVIDFGQYIAGPLAAVMLADEFQQGLRGLQELVAIDAMV